MSDIFDELNYTDEQVQEEMKKYPVNEDYYYYYMGLSYYDKKKYDQSIKYYLKAYETAKDLQKDIHKLHNSTGITYDEMRNNEKALYYYEECIKANPKYHSAYYNMAIVHKRMNQTDKAIEWYRKAIEINPRYSYAYNNLGNIYKNMNNYE
jgi:tetratricopeptide (TPR) repeat protein